MADERDISGTSGTDTSLALIEEQADASIRRVYQDGRWFFSVIDVIGVLTDSRTPRRYWTDMKRRIYTEEFREVLAACQQLKLPSSDGKLYATDCADFATLAALLHALPALHRRTTPQQPLASSPVLGPDATPDAGGCGIYAIHNTLTNERYIGSSHDMTNRFAQHRALLRRGQHHARALQAAWNTCGEDAFVFVVLEALPDTDQLVAVEQRYLDTEQPAYNSATSAQNWLTLPPIAEDRIQQLLLSLYDLQHAASGVQPPLFHALREAIGYGVVKPGRNFQWFLAAAARGVETWAAFGAFLRQCEQAG